ncbi:FxSxx-COOH system tetratricopeptide repeat protein [Spirillospora sp. CA-253888]
MSGQAGVNGQIATGDGAVQSQQNAHYVGPGPFVQAAPGSTVHLTSVPATPGQEAERLPVYLPPHAGELFVGREEELARLDAVFAAGGTAVVHQRVGALHGLGGIGKSTLAARWAATRRRPGQALWWITADTPANLHQGLADLAVTADPALTGRPIKELVAAALGWLNAHAGWLLVLDNATAPADLEPVLARLDGAAGGRVLITSRRATGWTRITRQIIALDVLPLRQAVQQLTETVTAERPGAELDGARQLCIELGCLPLAIDQAAGYLVDNACSPRVYLERLAAYPAHLYALPGPGSDGIDRTVARIWHATLDHLAATTPLAGQVLRVLGWLASDHIPRPLLDGLADLDERVAEQGGTVGAQEAVARLAAYNMITLAPDGTTISVHRLVQAVARTPAPEGIDDPHRRTADITAARHHATTLLNRALPNDPKDPGGCPAWRMLLPHIDALIDQAPADTDDDATALLCNETGLFLRDQGALLRSIGYQERARTAYDRVLGAVHPYTLAARNNLANAYRSAGDLERAIALHEAELADCARILGADHPDTLTSRNNLAGAYQAAGDLDRAIPLLQQTLADRARILGDDHPSTLNSRNNLAGAYRDAGNLEQTLALLKQALADRVRVLGDDHPDTLISRNNLAGAYRDAGDLEQAVPLLQQALADCRRVLGEDHPTTKVVRDNWEITRRQSG